MEPSTITALRGLAAEWDLAGMEVASNPASGAYAQCAEDLRNYIKEALEYKLLLELDK